MPQSPRTEPPLELKGRAALDNDQPPPTQGDSRNEPTPQPAQQSRRTTRSTTRTGPASATPQHQPPNPRTRSAARVQPVDPPPAVPATPLAPRSPPAPKTTPVKNVKLLNRVKAIGSTPPKKKASSTMSYAQTQPQRDIRREDARAEVTGHIVGPMAPQTFLQEFLPKEKLNGTEKKAKIQNDIFDSMSKSGNEEEMYGRWIDALKPCCGTKIVQADTHTHHIFDQDGHSFGPDITTYFGIPAKNVSGGCVLADADMLLEFKFNTSDDPFDDNGTNFERDTEGGKKTLGQITVYATAQLARQFRTHVFSLLVFPKYARLMRWDRSGVTVTKKINLLTKSSQIISDFFLRLQRAPPEIRGVDTTVRRAKLTAAQVRDIRKKLKATAETVLLEVDVGDRKFIIGDPLFFGASSPLGRATRCFRAYDPKTKQCFILKDTWRIYTPLRKPEHEICAKLASKEVKHIPKVELGQDVGESGGLHETVTQNYANRRWSKAKYRLRTFRHYRIVLEELGGHLGDCRNIRDAVSAIRDAAEAESQASELAFVEHRDISYANVMVKYDKEGNVHGYLIDWDMCIETDVDYGDEDVLPERTGTWFFIAAQRILMDVENRGHSRIDDIESLFHLLVYMVLLYTDNGLNGSEKLGNFVDEYFQRVEVDSEGRTFGGRGKLQFFLNGGYEFRGHIKNLRLLALIHDLIPPLAARYDKPPFEMKTDETGKLVCIEKDFPPEHHQRMALLDDRNWFATTLATHLAQIQDWDTRTKLVPQRIPVPSHMKQTSALSLPVQALEHSTLPAEKTAQGQKRKGAPSSPAGGESSTKKRKTRAKGGMSKKRI